MLFFFFLSGSAVVIALIFVLALRSRAIRIKNVMATPSIGPQKHEIAADLSNELSDNRLKCEMFVTIYTEKLHSMRDIDRRASYEDTSDFMHQHPPLSRMAFDRHYNHLHLLGPHIAAAVTRVYEHINDDPRYVTLESAITRDKALDIVEKIIENAEKVAAPIDGVIAGLQVILRDNEKNRKV